MYGCGKSITVLLITATYSFCIFLKAASSQSARPRFPSATCRDAAAGPFAVECKNFPDNWRHGTSLKNRRATTRPVSMPPR
jgi:hypothetical protein